MHNQSISRKAYIQKLKDPRWQKMRLEILNRDGWECQVCGDKESTLNVHHTHYFDDAEGPWDYPHHSLVTLCETCHVEEADLTKVRTAIALETLSKYGFRTLGDIQNLNVFMDAVQLLFCDGSIEKNRASVIRKYFTETDEGDSE